MESSKTAEREKIGAKEVYNKAMIVCSDRVGGKETQENSKVE